MPGHISAYKITRNMNQTNFQGSQMPIFSVTNCG